MAIAAPSREISRVGDETRELSVGEPAGMPAPPRPVVLARRATAAVRRMSLARFSFILAVIVPTLAVGVYALLWATPRYVSEFRVAVRSVEPLKSNGIAEMFGMGGMSQSGNDANAVVQYLHSRDSLESLEKRFPVRDKVMDASIDVFSRFHGKPDIEALTRYWNSMIDVSYETSTGTIIARVTAFSPDDAQSLAKLMLGDSEDLVNRLSRRVREDSVAFAEGEVAKAELRLAEGRKRLQMLQDKESVLDPMKAAEVNIGLAAKLKEQIAQRSAELATMRMQMSAEAPSVRSAEVVIAGLRRELQNTEALATASSGAAGRTQGADRPLSTVFGAFQQMSDERNFAEKAYQSALTSLEAARIEASRQQVYLSVIVPPGLPQEASFPRPLRQIGMTALIALALWLVGLLTVYSVREHM